MPKIKPSDRCRLRAYVQEFGENIFSTDGKILFCKVCEVKVAAEKKFTITQHISRDKHLRALNRKKEKEDNEKTQMFLNTTTNSSFNSELCSMMLSANIPISKLKHPEFRNFLFKHTGQTIPDESTIRKYYVSNCYNDTINNIRAYLKDKKLWISIDETTDVEGRFVANVVIGTLELGCPGKTFLFNMELLEKTNNSTIVKLFDKTMCLLYPEGVKHDNILLFVSDAAPYMVKAGKNIKALYSKMEHVTCLAHGLRRVAEEVRRHFPKVDALISNVKKIFVKCSSRVLKFKEIAPEVPMPPQPILTRWGTWLVAAIYYCEHYQLIKSVVMEFDKGDAVAIENAQTLFADNSLEFDLAFIKANYGNLPKYITTLETSGLLLADAVGIIEKLRNEIGIDKSKIGKTIYQKFENVIEKNKGYKAMKNISNILERNTSIRDDISEELTADDMAYMKFAPVTSCDVERSFSVYKTTLTDNRRRFLFENIKHHVIVQCNKDYKLDKVTSNLLLEADWPTTLEICDTIRQKDVQPKFALNAIKKKLISPNPHTAMYSLLVLECCVKNCGQLVHDEVGTKPFMEQIRETIKTTPHENVKNKLLELLQTWAFAFRAIPKYCAVQDTVNIMKAEGYTFPALKESDAMFSSDVAPGWEDSDCCHRCRVKFGMVQRKHHCRACGQVFCAQCSSRSCTLPKFGIEKPVRVCEACFEKSQKPQINKASEDLPIEYLTSSLAQQNQIPAANRKTEEELREDEELQLALALSQSEAEQQKGIPFMNSTSIPATRLYSSPPVNEKKVEVEAEDDPELARYLNRSYWESLKMGNITKTMQTKIASTNANTIESTNNEISPVMNNEQSDDSEEMELFITSVKSQLEIFVNRIKSNLSRGRTVINGGSLETFYSKITPMHQKLLQYIQQQDEKRLYFERLQDKLVQVKDTRAALDAMRDDHKAAIQQEAVFAEQQRQIQLAMKLDVLRQRKQQYQQYQHQMTLQQVQQQEQEMAMRMEHQRQNYLNSNMYGTNSLPSMPTAPNPYMSPGPNSLMSSQMQDNGIRYPQSTESAHFQHISQPQGFVPRHMIPQNPSSITNNQPVNLPSSEPNNMSQVNSNLPQPIYQPRIAPMTNTINSGVSVTPSMNSMHQQSLPGVGTHTQSMMPGHQQPQMQNMVLPQHALPVGQPMIPSQHQPPMMGQISAMPYGGPVHMGQYGAHQIPSQQVNPQPSAPNQVEQPKVEQPQVAELISFD